jgi:signal transduction histidine kinase
MTPVEEKLLVDLASQAGLVLKNVGLTAELLARLEDLRASRQRLVAAQDQERRRLERNLHDGAQQNLVALKVKLGLAQAVAEKDPARAKDLIAQLKSDADEALDTLRDLARGIYPPLLADKGLAAALAAQARKATVPVTVESEWRRKVPAGRGSGRLLLLLGGAPKRPEVRQRQLRHRPTGHIARRTERRNPRRR